MMEELSGLGVAELDGEEQRATCGGRHFRFDVPHGFDLRHPAAPAAAALPLPRTWVQQYEND
jgi:hypothetical protein